MSLTTDSVRRVLFLFKNGKIARSEECERLTRVLGSREEFVAWLFLRSGLSGRGATEALVRAAKASVVVPATRRTVEAEDHLAMISRAKLEIVMKELLASVADNQASVHDLDSGLARLLSRQQVDHQLGLQLVQGSDCHLEFRRG